jgi:hypothetical protein
MVPIERRCLTRAAVPWGWPSLKKLNFCPEESHEAALEANLLIYIHSTVLFLYRILTKAPSSYQKQNKTLKFLLKINVNLCDLV